MAQSNALPELTQTSPEDRALLDKAKTLFELQEVDESLATLDTFIEAEGETGYLQ